MSVDAPKVSIIVPVYNCEKYLHQCMDSLLVQTLADIEVICVNDGSTDSSEKILFNYAAKDKRVRIIHKENAGVSEARNIGLNCASGEFIMFVDSDDWIDAEMCEHMYQLAQKHNAQFVMCCYEKMYDDHSVVCEVFNQDTIVWEKKEIENNIHLSFFGPIGEQLQFPERADILVSPCMQLFSRKCIKNIRFHDIRKIGSFEDGLFQIEAYMKCTSLVYVNKPFYKYRKTNNESITTKFRPELPNQWKYLFSFMRDFININNLSELYKEALNNRICLSIIGLGLNQINSELGFIKNTKAIYAILLDKQYREAYNNLDFKWFPIHWKCFFLMCKWRWAPLVVLLLEAMDLLRRSQKGNKKYNKEEIR